MLHGEKLLPLSGGRPKEIMVLLHGIGSNGDDLISLAEMFAEKNPDMLFLAPNAPQQYSMGGIGYQWFPYWEKKHSEIVEGVEKAAAIVARYLDEVAAEHGVDISKITLVGFSQGAMVAVHTAITMQDNCNAVVSLSGGLIKVDITPIEIRSNPPICFIHGEYDEVVPFQMSQTAASLLKELNIDCEFNKIPMLGHSVDMECIKVAQRFLGKIKTKI